MTLSNTFKNVLLMLLLTAICAGNAWAGIPTEVTVNKSMLVNLNKPAERVSIANPVIADLISITPRQLQIIGLAIGSTTLIVWEKGNQKPTFFDINVISGKSTEQVLLQVKVAQVDRTAMKNLGISFMVKSRTGEGFSNIIGPPSGSNTVINTTSGINTSSATGIAGSTPALGTFNPLDAFTFGISHFPSGTGVVLKALATKNLAKILAEPNLVVRSGEKGKLLAGSKIPYPIVTSTGGTATSSIVFMDVGVKLNFEPVVMDDGTIHLKIAPAEVSTISGTLTVGGYPVIDTREVSTDVSLKDGECLVLAGLLQEDDIKTMSKVPLLGDIPFLGALFRSTSSDLREKELVFFITPKLIKPLAPGTKVDLPTDKQPTPEQERELQWIPTLK